MKERQSDPLEGGLEAQRLRVLRVVGQLALIGGFPLMLSLAAYHALRAEPYAFMLTEAVLTAVIGLVLRRAQPGRLGLPSWVFVIGFGGVCVLAFDGYGPLLGVGMMLFTWLFATVFLTGRILVPAAALTLLVACMGGAAALG